MAAGVMLMVAIVAGAVALTAAVAGPVEELSLEAAPRSPNSADFFDSALAGVAARRRGREVKLSQDRHGNVNLNVDIERNGVPAKQEREIKVPIGGSAQLKIPFSIAQNGAGGVEELEEDPADDDVDAAQQEVDSAKARVVEDAKRLNDIATAIKEEQANQAAAQQDEATREQAEVTSTSQITTQSPESKVFQGILILTARDSARCKLWVPPPLDKKTLKPKNSVNASRLMQSKRPSTRWRGRRQHWRWPRKRLRRRLRGGRRRQGERICAPWQSRLPAGKPR